MRTPLGPRVQQAGYRRALRPLLFAGQGRDPERAHEQMMRRLTALARRPRAVAGLRRLLDVGRAPVEVAGLVFDGPVGLAAGLDKRGAAVKAWAALGFGHVEIGTITRHPQPGNEPPRLFRLPDSTALINRMGFNNNGATATAARLAAQGVWRGNGAAGVPVGVSLGKSKVTPVEDAVGDYLASFDALAPHADYVAVNVSSPNTPGLRRLQDAGHLRELLTALVDRARGQAARPVPVLVKVAPDLGWTALDEVIEVSQQAGAAGLIATNTTVERDGLAAPDLQKAEEAGGLSGAPLTLRSRAVVAYLVREQGLPVIGVGGIVTADDALALLDVGARAVQLYTGFVYAGTALPAAINLAHRRRAARSEGEQ